jgi:DNA-binding protein YbaB
MADHGVMTGPQAGAVARWAQARGTGEAGGGQIRVTVDGTGDLVELYIDPRAMRRGSEDLADAIRAAFRAARSAARERATEGAEPMTEEEAVSALGGVGADLLRLGNDAGRRLADFAAAADQVSRRLDRSG